MSKILRHFSVLWVTLLMQLKKAAASWWMFQGLLFLSWKISYFFYLKNIICIERGRKKGFPLTEKKNLTSKYMLLISPFSCAYIIYISLNRKPPDADIRMNVPIRQLAQIAINNARVIGSTIHWPVSIVNILCL